MDVASLAIWLIVVIAVSGIVWAFVQYSGIPVPKPLMIVVYAVIAIAAILFLVRLAGGGGPVAVPAVR